ncbi:condensation domain-containing protein [Streptomyces sp. GLT-R25]
MPTLWEQLLSAAEEQVRRGADRPDLSALRWVHVGGEALPAAHVRRWFDLFGTGTRIANLYGPTEATINATCHVIDVRPDDDVQLLPIGRPVAGTELEVVGPDGTPCGPGGFGELLIAGVGLTPGYLGEPDLTARAFAVRDGRRWYRSGDRVRRGEGGTLEFLGRVDDQVKIRGNRVEPGEVEAALQTHPGIARAAVTAYEGRLLAFVTVRPGSGRPDTRDVRGHLSDIVPPYMIPARITVVDALPLTGTGKVDRRALSDRATASVDRAGKASTALPLTAGRGTPPATPTERRLAAIWSELLEADLICREDDFFDLGGDSMLVLQVFARLGEQEGPLPRPTAIYRHRTLAALAAAVDAAIDTPAGQPCGTRTPTGTVTAAGSRPTGEDHTSPFPLTPGQRGFLLAEELSPGGGSWLARLRLSGPLDQEVFQAAVDLLVERHAMLRTVFPSGARPPVQQELPRSLRLPVVFETLRDRVDADERAAEAGRRFEPWTWPLLRLRVLTLAPHEHVLLVHAHHLIGDGYSAALLMQELTDAYDLLTADRTAELSTPRATFRDHCLLLAETGVESETGSGAAAACGSAPDAAARRARLSAPYQPPVLRAPDDGSGSGSTTTGGATPAFHSAEFVLDATRTAALRALAAGAGATLYAPLLTAYYEQLAEATGQADLILGLAVSGRDRPLPDVHRIFGPFAAAVPVRPGATAGREPMQGHFGDALRRIVAEAEEARTHDDVLPRHANGLPVTSQFFFTFLDFSALAAPNGGTLTVSWEDADSAFAPPPTATDVFMAVRPDADGLRVTLRGSARAFSPLALDGFAHSIRARLTRAASPEPAVSTAEASGDDGRGAGRIPARPRPSGTAGGPARRGAATRRVAHDAVPRRRAAPPGDGRDAAGPIGLRLRAALRRRTRPGSRPRPACRTRGVAGFFARRALRLTGGDDPVADRLRLRRAVLRRGTGGRDDGPRGNRCVGGQDGPGGPRRHRPEARGPRCRVRGAGFDRLLVAGTAPRRGHPSTTEAPAVRRTRQRTATDGTGPEPA